MCHHQILLKPMERLAGCLNWIRADPGQNPDRSADGNREMADVDRRELPEMSSVLHTTEFERERAYLSLGGRYAERRTRWKRSFLRPV